MEEVNWVEPYVVEKDYGDVVLYAFAYRSLEGLVYLRKSCIFDLPEDVSRDELDENEWIEVGVTS